MALKGTWGAAVAGDFDYTILDVTDHRPWPMPERPWIMRQTWTDLLFAHWSVDVRSLAESIPRGLELDLFEGRAWIGVVPFFMSNVAPRGVIALPWISAFAELNVRTYVRAGDRAGVFFFSLDAANLPAVIAARTVFHLPYYKASMQIERDGSVIRYSSRRWGTGRPAARFRAIYEPVAGGFHPTAGTLEYFLTERYCLFTAHRGQILSVDIHHPPWLLHPAAADIAANTMAPAASIALAPEGPLLHFVKRQDMVAWGLTRVA